MSYSSSIPNASDPRAQSQSQILANFQTINSVWAVNHSNLTGDDPQGRHDVLTIRSQTTDPTTSATQIALYNKLVSSIPELFFRPKSNGTPIQLTYPSQSATSGAQQYSFVAGPFVINGGFILNSGGIPSGTTITVPGGTSILFASCTTSGASYLTTATPPKYVVATNFIGNTFQAYFLPGTLKVPILYYFTIGQ